MLCYRKTFAYDGNGFRVIRPKLEIMNGLWLDPDPSAIYFIYRHIALSAELLLLLLLFPPPTHSPISDYFFLHKGNKINQFHISICRTNRQNYSERSSAAPIVRDLVNFWMLMFSRDMTTMTTNRITFSDVEYIPRWMMMMIIMMAIHVQKYKLE